MSADTHTSLIDGPGLDAFVMRYGVVIRRLGIMDAGIMYDVIMPNGDKKAFTMEWGNENNTRDAMFRWITNKLEAPRE